MIPRLTELPTQNNDSAVAPSMRAHELAAAHHRMRTAPLMGLGPSLGLAPRPPSADVSLAARQALPFTPPAEDHRDSIEHENAALAKLNDELKSMWPMRRHPAPMVHGPGREHENAAMAELNDQLQHMWPTLHESAKKRDATRIRLHNDPESVAKARRSKLDKQVRRASNQADVDALEHQAEG
ncbi:MAG: hypothetical protein JF606_00435, partial [Burkholderiales bacterium]|nr:hypothetical protein [Burkholderiales bacterium]